jgi:hypothetical protein
MLSNEGSGAEAMSNHSVAFRDVPRVLEPNYSTGEANAEIPLYEGTVNLHHDQRTYSGSGRVFVSWLPTPRVRFESGLTDTVTPDLLAGDTRIELVDKWPGKQIEVAITGLLNLSHVSGIITSWVHDQQVALQRVMFHIPNFSPYQGIPIRNDHLVWAGRTSLVWGDWTITIDEIADKTLWQQLKETGGFGITHVGCLQRQGGGTFSHEEGASQINCLYWLLSFYNGKWTGPILPVWFDANSESVWHEWIMPLVTPFRNVPRWVSDLLRCALPNLYPGFAARWSDETWRDCIHNAIYWYLMPNAPGVAIENGIILAHVAFETLGWTLFVQDKKTITANRYDKKINTADKLRLLLNEARVPLAVPSELASLEAAAKADKKWCDGPGSLAAIRNAYVHSSPENRKRLADVGPEAEHEAWLLSLYYLELILLYLCNYNGEFSNRLVVGSCAFGQEVMNVPWASETPKRS